jgi:hypothetical protein
MGTAHIRDIDTNASISCDQKHGKLSLIIISAAPKTGTAHIRDIDTNASSSCNEKHKKVLFLLLFQVPMPTADISTSMH